MEIYVELSEMLTKLKERNKYVEQQLKRCPNGHLSFESLGKTNVLVQELNANGKRHRHRLADDSDLAIALLRKTALQDEYKAVSNDIKLLSKLINNLYDYSSTKEIQYLMNRYPNINQSLFQHIFDSDDSTGWASEPYEKSEYKLENQKQINSHGLKVRSKSEVLITEKYYEYNIKFRYEQVFHVGKIDLIPDFTIRRDDGKIFIWEHEGLTNVKEYLDWQMRKHQLYASIGFVPWDNLIVTYDNADGIIDLRIVESEIKNKLLI